MSNGWNNFSGRQKYFLEEIYVNKKMSKGIYVDRIIGRCGYYFNHRSNPISCFRTGARKRAPGELYE